MINLNAIDIKTIDDYDLLNSCIMSEYLHQTISVEIKERIGLKANQVIVEYPYYDLDYLSTYYLFYSKKHKDFEKKCYRLHFLRNNTYLGYLTLRPTIANTKIGKSYLCPSLTLSSIFFKKA